MTRNTILYNLVFIVLGTVPGIAVGIMLSELRKKAETKFFQTVILLPYLLSWVICAYIGYAFLSKDTGLINNFLNSLGLEAVDWYNVSGKMDGYIGVSKHLEGNWLYIDHLYVNDYRN